MSGIRQRPLPVGALRSFEAVARHLSFRIAAEELYLTQSAVSRQIQGLEDELGASLFSRGTRHVELTGDGAALLRAVAPLLDRLDATVRQIRQAKGRRVVSLSTFASFASLWLIPRLQAFQREHPDIDIRVSASDRLVDLDEEFDLVLRYCSPAQVRAVPGAQRLFGEQVTPVVSPWLLEQVQGGRLPSLAVPTDLARHALLEEDDHRPSAEFLSWRHWLARQGAAGLEPQRWIYLNYTYQQVQGALVGQGVALARLALVDDSLAKGELLEPFGAARRVASPYAYWLMVPPERRLRPEVRQFCDWVRAQAAQTRRRIGEEPETDGLGEHD
ncbi:LysR substrate-binding domain-containing protein [Caldimonas tepidiphila]|uniref:LysR substrate-binding domain-containing protein n=1 Tax=Caldimonas tepidiphila TaxID=2315841 RepID=UPI000E5C3C8A|nr:LysR substrate-binding domain-containing protein [Caldimonas tepidiphila]